MSQIDITRAHSVSLKKGKVLLKDIADKLAKDYGGSYTENAEGLDFEGPGISGTIVVDTVSIRVVAKLGLLMRPIKGVIEKQIHSEIDAALAKAG